VDRHDRLLWAALGMVAVLITVSGLTVFGALFLAPAADSTVKEMIEGRIIARAIVLFMIIPIIFVLCAQDKITGEAALASLSAIAGYILGGTTASQ
jgi:predicted membrane-bound dolichyl-phosphate-mannose-protein mannosyltransferase